MIHIKLSEAVSTASAFDLHLGSGRSLAGTTFSPVGASSGYASEFQILLNAGASVSANDVLILGRQSVVDQQGQKPAGDLLFVLPKLPQPAPAMPAFSLSIDVFGDSNVNSSETSPMTGIHAAVTSSSLASLVVSGLRQASAHQETAVWNPSTELYEFDATQFDDGVLSVLARDIYGQSQSFSLTKDATAPLLSGSSPLDNATGVAVGSDIQLTFNENVQLGTFGLISLYKSDNTLIESFDVSTNLAGKVSVANGVVTINPTADLDAGTGYYILIDAAAIKDTVGNNYAGLSGVGDLNFTTLQPGILGTSGADSLTGTVAADTIYGFAGNDTITGGAGSDALYGGADADVFVVNAVSGVSSESNMSNMDRINDFESGVDHLQINMTEVQSFDGSGVYPVSYGSYVALGGAGSDFYVGVSPTGQNPMAGIAGATNVVVWFSSMSQASAAYNSLQYNITGTASADNIVAGANDDTVTGGGGNDVIDLGAGMNTVVVGAILTAGTDVVTGIGSDDKISFSTVVAYADLTSNGDMRTLFDPMSPTPRSLIEAATLLVGSSDGWALGFIYDNKNYVVIDGHANHYAFDATTDAIVELVGTTLSALGSGNFIS